MRDDIGISSPPSRTVRSSDCFTANTPAWIVLGALFVRRVPELRLVDPGTGEAYRQALRVDTQGISQQQSLYNSSGALDPSAVFA